MPSTIETQIRQRKSIRSYDSRPLTEKDKNLLLSEIEHILQEETPFPARIHIQLLEAREGTDTEKLGTYGVIRGASSFLGVTVENSETAPEAVGYTFEKVVLKATEMGLGTCWMAGTFNKDQFKRLLLVKEDEIFPIISPLGYPQERLNLVDKVFRKVGKSDQRKDWNELFFKDSFEQPLSREEAGEYVFALDMLRLAPSAANKQPWRIVYKDNVFHFFRVANPSSNYPFDLQRLDAGIAACHFHLAAKEKELKGIFVYQEDKEILLPENTKYIFSWKEEI